MNPKVKIILVEDVETDALLAVHEIRKAIPDIELVTVDTEEAFREALASFHPDLVVTDYSLPSFDGMTALKIALAHDALIPVIIFTGSQNESIAVECIKSGAVDYVLKEQQRRLGQAVVNALKQKEVQRKKEEALAMLAESEQTNRYLYESMAQGVIYRDHQGKIIRMNRAAQSILGIDHFDAGDQSADPLFHSFYDNGTSVPREAYPAIRALFTGQDNHITLLYYNRQKDIRKWITHHSRPEFRKGEKKPFRVFSTMEDITEHKRLISEISQLNQLLAERVVTRTNEINRLSNLHSAILDNAGTAVMVFNHDDVVQLFNPAAERMFGYVSTALAGKPAPRLFKRIEASTSANSETFHETDNQSCKVADLLKEVNTSRDNWVGIRNDGTTLPVKLTVSTFRDETGSEAGIIAIAVDTTAEKEAEEALRRNESLMKLVMATSPQALLVVDHGQDTVLYCNQKLSDIWGQPGLQVRISGKASAVFTQLADTLASDDSQVFLELQDPGNHAVCEKTIQLKGGNFIKCYTDLILGESGKCYGRLYTFEDVTREEEYARSLRVSIEKEKELNELKSKIVRLTSHEFKTPLASILMASETLQHYGMKNVEGKFLVYFDRIDKNVLYMKEMIDKFLNLSRLESGHLPVQLTPADLVQFTREWLVDYHDKNTPSATILFKSECDECNMHMDTYLMEQVLNNLVSNGIKYSPEGSTVTIEVAATDDTASITITDQGIGIPVDEQQNVFSTFFRASNARKAAGTGLGLATVKQIVELHGGRIGITSEENRGTQVKVELPLN